MPLAPSREVDEPPPSEPSEPDPELDDPPPPPQTPGKRMRAGFGKLVKRAASSMHLRPDLTSSLREFRVFLVGPDTFCPSSFDAGPGLPAVLA